jgi:ABC-type transport system substrate-binding protein
MRAALDAGLPRATIAGMDGMPPWPTNAPVDLHDPTAIDLRALERASVAADWGMAGLPGVADYDDDAAAAAASVELDALGWPMQNGLRRRATGTLRLVLMWDGVRGQGARIATAVRDAWRGVGVHVPYATASWSYILGLMRRGEFDLGLCRIAGVHDLFTYFHSRGELNLTGVSDPALDEALEAYRHATDQAGRRQAELLVATRLAELRPVSVVHAPTRIMLTSRRVTGLSFVDDLPRLDRIELGPESSWTAAR